ncbi:hypothetical protein UG55_100740 [Frankia sp. EI5c]|nr:hypothetical protein UG55_100740 [Frankia sp. EI5c]
MRGLTGRSVIVAGGATGIGAGAALRLGELDTERERHPRLRQATTQPGNHMRSRQASRGITSAARIG